MPSSETRRPRAATGRPRFGGAVPGFATWPNVETKCRAHTEAYGGRVVWPVALRGRDAGTRSLGVARAIVSTQRGIEEALVRSDDAYESPFVIIVGPAFAG
jgi:hypothetical protein